MSTGYHIPVLLHASIQALITNTDGIYVDATFGGGGHSREILRHLSSEGKLFCFDQDPAAEKNFINEFSATNATFIPQNFRFLQKFLRVNGVSTVDGILADLGVSSHQFDEGERGFSIRFDARLDMRMNPAQQISAYDIINTSSVDQLKNIFGNYGEVRNANQLARTIIDKRNALRALSGEGISTTGELKDIALSVAKGERMAYLAKVFQAIRISVNEEIIVLKEMLENCVQLLKPGGRLVVISYHSLEDRLVKNIIRTGNTEGDDSSDLMGRRNIPLKSITKKPVLPEPAEIAANPRARSAKMRVAEKSETVH